MCSRTRWTIFLASLWAAVLIEGASPGTTHHEHYKRTEQELPPNCPKDSPVCIVDSKLVEVESCTEDVVMDDLGIDKIKPRVFETCDKTKTLVMTNNKLSSLSGEMFTGLSNVTSANFFNNSIESIANSTFTQMPELKELDLSYNHLKGLSADARNGLGNLGKLHLNEQPIRLVKNGFRGLTNLELLELSGDKIRVIVPGSLDHLDNLKRLDLSKNKISTLGSSSLASLRKLEELDLSSNFITWFNKRTFQGLENLKNLWLTGNRLNALIADNTFKGITNLHNIYLHNNPLQFVNLEIFNNMKDLMVEPGFSFGSSGLVHKHQFHDAPITWCIVNVTGRYYEAYDCQI